MSRFVDGLEMHLAAFQLKHEEGWEHPLLWDDRDFSLITKSLAGRLGYRPDLAPKKTAAQFLAHQLALAGLHQVERHFDGIPKVPTEVGDDESEELRKAVGPVLVRQGGR